MKILASALLTNVLLLFCARADLTIVQNVEGGGPVTTMTMKIKSGKARIEASPQMTTIIDSRSGEILTLMNEQKKFMRISASQAKAAAEMATDAGQNGARAIKPQLKPTGKKEIINGCETEEYSCEAPAFKAIYSICTQYPNAAAILKELTATTPEAWNVAGKGMPDYRDFPGLPMRTRVAFGGKEIVTNLVSVKQDPLSDADFVPPAGFEEMKMPAMDSILGHKPRVPKAAPSPRT